MARPVPRRALSRAAAAAPLLLAPPLLAACSPTRLAGALTPRGGTERREGLAYGAGGRRRLDLYLPAAPGAGTPLLAFFYGGAWQQGRRGDYAFLGRVLAARGVAVAVPDYRVWPESGWPGFVEDAAEAVAWLGGPEARAAGAPAAGPLFLMGHSAGGFIAAALALDERGLGAGRLAALAGCATLAAPSDWTPRGDPLAGIFAAAPGGAIRAAPEDPALLAGAPPLLLLHGAADRTVRPEQSERMAARLRGAGGRARLRVFPGVGHIGILSAMAVPVRALGLAGAPVLEEVTGFVAAAA